MDRDAWRAVFAPGADSDAAIADLERRYAEPWRRYHVAEHVDECLALLDRARDLSARSDELAAAIYYHDAVYVPGAANNEERSAELAMRALIGLGWDELRAASTAELVAATAHLSGGRAGLGLCADADRDLIRDIDLAILGTGAGRYERYARDVREEHAEASDDDYARGRIRVLELFLGERTIYTMPDFIRRLEAAARRNMEAERDRLLAFLDERPA